MKRTKTITTILMALALLLGSIVPAFAAQYVSISEINDSLPERWTQSYETKWRTVEIDVEPTAPDVDNFPILKVEPDMKVPDLSPLGDGWESDGDISFGIFNAFQNGGGETEWQHAEKKLGGVQTSTHYYPPFEMEKVYAENSDITLAYAIEQFKSILLAIGENPEDVWLERPVDILCNKNVDKKTGENLLPGTYSFAFEQLLTGIPLFRDHVDRTVKRSMREEVGYYTLVSYDITTTDAACFGWRKVKIVDSLSEDVPLRDFSAVQEVLEKEINDGHIRKIFDVDLGYALYHDADLERTADYPNGMVYYALPVWRVNCLYAESAKKEIRDYTGLDAPERGSMEYLSILIDAQTGNLIDGQETGAANYEGFISWEDVGGKQ